MRNSAFDLAGWSFSDADRILPDANFWINVFGPIAAVGNPSQRVQTYSNSLQRMIRSHAQLFLDVLILSEFVNTLARQEFNSKFISAYGAKGFKRFRDSADFQPVAKMIASECRKICRLTTRVDHSFSNWSMGDLLEEFGKGGEDFNDQMIVESAKQNGFMLLTDDGDMIKGGLKVLTANPRLIQACGA